MDGYRIAASDIAYQLDATARAEPASTDTTGTMRRRSFRRVMRAVVAASVVTLPCATPATKVVAATRRGDVARVAQEVIDLLGFQHVCTIASAVYGEQLGSVPSVPDEELEALLTVCGSTSELTQRATPVQLCRLLGMLRAVVDTCARDPYLGPTGKTGSKLRDAVRKVFDAADVAFLVHDVLPHRAASPRKRK